ncbi:YceI family protein [Winogradskyella sp. PE311]|uniref:YceI family protein n=1 Tax=Winogradskyella sp. PE311 TaxID=3366943 RepID=UPI00398014C7
MRIKNITTLFICSLISILTFGQSKSIDTKKSTLEWTGKAAFNAYALSGTLKAKSGEILIENDSIKTLKIVIDMKSLNHENKDLKSHLRGKDFFEVKTYTKAIFLLEDAVRIQNRTAKLRGKLTIKDITKTETFTIKLDEVYSELTFDITIDRTDYGVKFNSPSFFKKMKENAIADDFKLKGSLKLN